MTTSAPHTAPFTGADITLDALERDPYPLYARLRTHAPVTWVPALNMWYVVTYAEAERILHDTEHFVTGTPGSVIHDTFGEHMLTVEGPRHDRYKAATRRTFTPKGVRETMEIHIRTLTDRLIDGFIRDGRAELSAAFASRLPVQAMLALFGLPPEEEAHLRDWYNSFEAALANFTWEDSVRTTAKSNVAAFHALLDRYMARCAGTDDPSLLGQLVNAPDGERLSDDEIRRNASIIFFGGISTVEALTLNALYALFTHPETLERVRHMPDLLPQTLEETIRWMAPVQSATRHVTKDVTFGDVTFREGQTVNCMLGAANRDPAMFEDPDSFNIDRRNVRRHMGFAIGTHHCLGSHLAKAEARIALECLFRRLPNLRPAPGTDYEPHGYEFRQPEALHVIWDT